MLLKVAVLLVPVWNGLPPLAVVYHLLVLLPEGCVAVNVKVAGPQLVAPFVPGAPGCVWMVALTDLLPLSQPVLVLYALT